MFSELTIKNFQSHKLTQVKLKPGVNVIRGDNDSGKTAIMRAFRWLIFNLPRGDNYRSHWGGTTQVSTGDLARRRGGKENCYQVGDNVLKAMGNDIPDAVLERLNITDINWQGQLDAAFLLSDTAGEVARKLNEMVNLTIIDTTFQNLQGETRAVNSDLKATTISRDLVLADIKPLDGLEVVEAKAVVLENISTTIAGQETRCDKLGTVLNRLQEVQSALLPLNKGLDAATAKVSGLMCTGGELGEATRQLYTATATTTKMVRVTDDLKSLHGVTLAIDSVTALSAKVVNINNSEPKLENLEALLSKRARVLEQLKGLQGVALMEPVLAKLLTTCESLDEQTADLCEASSIVRQLANIKASQETCTTQISDAESELPDTCPLCGVSE